MAVRKFRVEITNKHITDIHIDTKKKYKKSIDPQNNYFHECYAHEFYSSDNLPQGVIGLAIYKAVKKIFGKNCFWQGNYDNVYLGQVFEPLKNDTCSTSRTNQTYINITEY